MKIRSLALGLVITWMGISQVTEAKALRIRVYDGNDFESYYVDPPYWSYRANGLWQAKGAHWLYKNHRYVFIDIRIN